jgi:PAS domain S-box-containing protein
MNPPARVLIVEDECLVASDLQCRLETLGYEVTDLADTAEGAIAAAKAHHPDLVLMDIHLAEGSDGVTAARKIHGDLGVPIVFLTAHADAATLDRAADAVPYGYIVKPFQDSGLAATVQMALARRDAEQKVEKMERWLATTLRSIGDAVISVDREGCVNYFNPEAERLTGWRRSEVLGRDFREVLPFAHEDPDMLPPTRPLAAALEHGLVVQLAPQTELIAKSGARVTVDDTAAPTRDEAGVVDGAVMILRDRSQQRRDAEERRKIEQKMQETQRLESLGLLAGGIAHDFNNLLGIMTVNAELVSTHLPAKSREQPRLREILDAGRRAAELCDQMLAYAGGGKYQESCFDLGTVVDETASLLRRAVSKKARLRLQLDRNLPTTIGDHSQLRQVVMNLVINASDAFEKDAGTIAIETSVVSMNPAQLAEAVTGRDLPAGFYLQLEVRDNGCGMCAETIEKIFDPFFTTKFTGRGLGLAAVLGIVRGHRGALLVESNPGLGTSLRVLLPIVAGPLDTAAPTAEVPRTWRSQGTVLVVDDETPIREAAALVLEERGFTVLQARNGAHALEILDETREEVRLILTDLTMPIVDGFELAHSAARLYPDLPILVMTGYTAEDAAERFARLPIRGLLHKPFSVPALEQEVWRILEGAVA